MKRKYLSFILLMSLVWSLVIPGLSSNTVQAAEQGALGYVTVSVEKFTLGQGYYREPARVPYYEGENGADVLLRLLGEGNARYSGAVDNNFYLTAVKDMNAGQPVIPDYILEHAGEIGPRKDRNWLAEFDYTDMSGWNYYINHSTADFGLSDYVPQNGDVLRVQFSVHGWGADLGFGWEGSYIEVADKDELTSKLAEINSSPYLTAAMLDSNLAQVYQEAYAIASNMESTQESVGSVLAKLSTALALVDLEEVWAQHYPASLGHLVRSIPNPTYNHSEWAILALARAGYEVPASYYNTYYSNIEAKVTELMERHGGVLDRNRGTEHSRLILALTALDKDVTDVAGFDLRNALADFTYVNRQGINGPIFALIGLNSQQYRIPELHEEGNQSTRAKMVAAILEREIGRGSESAGGWALSGSNPDPDITSMAIQALTPYYSQDAVVKSAIDRGLAWLSAAQRFDGNYVSWGASNAESSAQVIVALTGLGIDPHTDPRFIKNGISVVDAMMSYGVPGGGFKHVKTETRANGMASDQAGYALVAYERFLNGKNSFYDMTDIQSEVPGEQPQIEWPIPAGEQPSVVIPDDQRSYLLTVTPADKDKQLHIEIPEGRTGAVHLQLPEGQLPRVEAMQGNAVVVLPQGGEVVSGDTSSVRLFGPSAVTAAQVAAQLDQGTEVEQIVRQFSLGGESRIGFSDFVSLTFTGLKGHGAAFAEQGEVTLIPQYDSKDAGESSGDEVFSYRAGDDLIVMTKHFTDFVVYRQKAAQPPGGGDGGGPGPPPATSTVTLSVDKLTINKGYVLDPITVPLHTGDNVWDVLKRTLDDRGIDYETTWSGKYSSVYVASIAGDGEFDHGSASGWMYNVNGTYPNVGASNYEPKNGDRIAWRYTTNLGADLGAPPPGGDSGSGGSGGGGAVGGGTSDRTPEIVVPSSLTADYTVKLADKDKQTDHITIRVPQSTHAILLDLQAVASAIPQVSAIRGDLTLHIAKGTKLTSGGPAIRLLNAIEIGASDLEVAMAAEEGEKTEVRHAFTLAHGTEEAEFDRPLTVTVKGGSGQEVAYNTAESWKQVPVYASEQAAAAAVQASDVYAITSGQDLVIRTKTAAAFLTYSVDTAEEQPETGTTNPIDPNADYLDRSSIAGWAYDGIARATGLGWLQGNEGNFRPQADITRAEFTKLLTELMGLNTTAPAQSAFTDVRADQWFHPYVQAAYEAGLVNGYGERFEPQATITREQMAVMIARALDLPEQPAGVGVTDAAQIAEWARSEVAAVYAAGLMTGDANRFHPQRQVSREMAAVVAVRAYEMLESGIPAAPTPPAPPAPEPEPEQPAPDAALPQVQRSIADAAGYLQRTVTSPAVASVGGEWTVFGLSRSQVDVPATYYDRYLTNLEETLKAADGVLHRVKYTEYDRVILALTALGKPVDNVAGYSMLQPLADYDTLIKQGINGPIFALIALDSKGYDIPAHTGSGTQTSRQQLVDFILNREISGGGWALDSQAADPDPDLTAMAIQALTPYYGQQDRVKAAVDRGVAWLSQAQAADGGYLSWGASNSESAAEVVVALTGLGIDPHTDPRFIKNGSSALDALLGFAVAGSGFYHILPGGADNGGAKPGEVDVMATDQALYALVAYERYATGKNRLYDLTDAN